MAVIFVWIDDSGLPHLTLVLYGNMPLDMK